jgi:hypothetical protein
VPPVSFLCGARGPQSAPLETTSVRIAKIGAICLAPQYVSEELLRAEGFTDSRYVELSDNAAIGKAIGRSEADFSTAFARRSDPGDRCRRTDRRAGRRRCREYTARYPVATKRVIRAILKAADLCASNPELAARQIVEGGFAENYDYAAGADREPLRRARRLADGGRVARADCVAQTLADNNYKWREFDPEDEIRWYALRMRETGLIKSTPQQIIADGSDWCFLNELKRELKA